MTTKRAHVDGGRLLLSRVMRRANERLAERVIVDGPLTDTDRRRGKELAAERGWDRFRRGK